MMDAIDAQLLESYVRDKSEGAFRQIVERYGQMAYSAAYRQLQDHHLAEDAAQAAFIILARKAHTLGTKTMLGGWIWRTATNCAWNLIQKRTARTRRERHAAELGTEDGETLWQRLAPELDRALTTLSAATRDTLVAHYLLGKTQKQVAEEAGLHVDTVHKRIKNGLSRLRRALTARGIAVPSALLGSLLADRTAEAVSIQMTDALHAVAYGTVTGATAPATPAWVLAKGVMRMMTWTRIKMTAAWTAACLTVIGLSAALAVGAGLLGGELRMPAEPAFTAMPYPRALLEAPAGRILDFDPDSWAKHDLDGTWKLKTFPLGEQKITEFEDPGLAARCYDPAVPTRDWVDIPVPYPLNRHRAAAPDAKTTFRGAAWYRRAFALPAGWTEKLAANWRVLLRFERIGPPGHAWNDDWADVWVNAQPVGEGLQGRNAFEFDISDRLNKNAENTIAVRVMANSTRGDARYSSGLWQPVRLICVPPVHARQVRIATPVAPPSLHIKATVMNYGAAADSELEALLTPYNIPNAPPLTVALGTQALNSGGNEVSFRVETPGVTLWSPDHPNLYLLTLRDAKQDLCRIRTGFRTVETRDSDFYLNGNKIKLTGFQLYPLNLGGPPSGLADNIDNSARKLLYGLKQANVNFGRPHGTGGGLTTTLYNLCDELGILILDDNDYASQRLYNAEKLTRWGEQYRRWVLHIHNHPSCALFSFGGNERYTRDTEMVAAFNYLYALLEQTDLQHRPKTSSSGRLTFERLERFPELEKSDFSDSHRYNGFMYGSYQEFIALFARQNSAATKRYGNMPTINCEWGFPGDTMRYRANTPEIGALYRKRPWGEKEKQTYIELATAERGETGGYLRYCANWAGGRMWSTDPVRVWERHAEFSKRYFEVFRRSGFVIDGGHFNTRWYDLLLWSKGGHEGFHAAIKYLGVPCPWDDSKEQLIRTPSWYVWRRVYNPTFICLDIYDKNAFAGRTWQTTVHIMNDSHQDEGPARAVLQLRAPTGKLIHQECVWEGRVSPYLRQAVPAALSVPAVWPTGAYSVELFLLGRMNRRLSDNSYPLNVVNRRDLHPAIRPQGKVALYEAAPEEGKQPEVTTADILESRRIPYQRLRDLRALKDIDVLIIGRNSLDVEMTDSGPAISEWVRAGGRLLCFEQSKAVQIPFLPEVSVLPGKRATYTELLVPEHPVFAGLSQSHFDDWNGYDGLLFKNVLSPMNAGLLASGPTSAHNNKDSIRAVCAAYALGKGEVVLSQYELTRRYGKDSIATRFALNLLAYIMTRPRSEHSLPFDSQATVRKRVHLEKSHAHYVDLCPAINNRLDSWPSFPRGETELSGDVPFRIAGAPQNAAGCIALRGSQQEKAPVSTEPVPVGKRLSMLYLLHYATYAGRLPEKDVVYTLTVHYADGTRQSIPIRNKVEVGDWWQAGDLSAAQVVFREGSMNAFLTEIALPGRPAPVKSLSFESAGRANPVILAVTGRLAG